VTAPTLPLACTVRDCAAPLGQRGDAFVCRRGHSYDIARSGYLNLLQPQDRRSRSAGDNKAAIEARARLLASGVGRTILNEFVERAVALDLPEDALAVDLGSGGGDALNAISTLSSIAGIGIDLSTAAAEFAARRFPALTWVVANADRRVPLLDESVDLVLSLHGRRNPSECARVLTRLGFLLVAVPAYDDLIELRASVLGARVERHRADRLLDEHRSHFTLIERFFLRERHHLDAAALRDLLRGTYRGKRTQAATRAETLEELAVTLSSEVFVLRRTPHP
jgi:23S rRNA (guanine745-N1)-methyltransferase